MSRFIKSVGLPVLLILSASCAKMCAPDKVAMGVARLTTLNADALVNALNDDTVCGFSAPEVLGAPTFDPTLIGRVGTMTWTVDACVIDLGTTGQVTSTNCRGEETRAFGRATVSGTKTITGHLTGNPAAPIIPSGPDSVLIDLEATFDNFHAEKDGGSATMTWVSGGLSGRMMPRLAVGATGACAVQTTNTAFSDVQYRPTVAILRSASDEIEVEIDSSDLRGQFGLGPSGENDIQGPMGIWGKVHDLPIDGDARGLDPDYDPAEFIEGFECKESLVLPISYSCDLRPMLGQNAARGLVSLIGVATAVLEGHPGCGFASDAANATAEQEGTPGGMGSLTFNTLDAPCLLNFTDETELSPNCLGARSVVQGSVTARTEKIIDGFLTGDANNPIVPMSRESTSFIHEELDFQGFTVFDRTPEGDGPTLAFTGTVSAIVNPVAGEATDPANPIDGGPLYIVPTPVAGFESIVSASGTFVLQSGGNTFVLALEDVELEAFNGAYDGQSNAISGNLMVDEAALVGLPDPRLNPAFDQDAFNATYDCNPTLEEPVPHE
jgi:hypothetical protein